MKKTASVLAALAILLYWAVPSSAGKKALSEDDLDRITAAGEPTIIQVSGVDAFSTATIEISYEDANLDTVAIEQGTGDFGGGQENLRALVLNNIAGENLAANALNIAASSGGGSQPSASQSNQITQSWGAVKITDIVTVTETVSVSATATASAGGGAGAGAQGGFCVGICKGGGDGDAEAEVEVGALLATIAYPVFMSADLIIHVEDIESETDEIEVTIDVEKNSVATVAVGAGAQTNLAALVVNNVAGKNLVANAINITGGNINTALDNGDARVAIGSLSQNIGGQQSNSISQFRGTPINTPQPVAVGAATPAGCGIVGVGGFGC